MWYEVKEYADCTKCPWLCCYSLTRLGSGYADNTSVVGKKCKYLCEERRCTVHVTLLQVSPDCSSYSCHWAWEFITSIYGLEWNEIPNSTIQNRFSLLQHLSRNIYDSQRVLASPDYPHEEELRQLKNFYEEALRKLSKVTTDEEWELLEQQGEKDDKRWLELIN